MGYGTKFPRMGHDIWLFHDGRPNHIETKDLHHERVKHLNLKWHGLFCFLKGCLTQILLDPLSNTLPGVFLTLSIFLTHYFCCLQLSVSSNPRPTNQQNKIIYILTLWMKLRSDAKTCFITYSDCPIRRKVIKTLKI